MPRTLLGIAMAAAALLAGCKATETGIPQAALVTSTVKNPDTSGSKPAKPAEGTTKIRFIVLASPDGKAVDIADSADLGKKFVTGLKPGSVSDYVSVPISAVAVDSTGQPMTQPMDPGDLKNPRNTIVVGKGKNGPEGYFFPEKDGRIELSGSVPANADSVATLVSIGFGLDVGNLKLGAGGKCVDGMNRNQSTIEAGGAAVLFAADPGSLELAWFGDNECQESVTANVKASVAAGKSGYVLPWRADPVHLRFLYVPITSDKPGKDGVVDPGNGPAATYDNPTPAQTTGAEPTEPSEPGN